RGFNYVAEIDQGSGNVIEHRYYRGGFIAYPAPTLTRSDGTTLTDAACFKGREYEVRWLNAPPTNPFSFTASTPAPTATAWTTWSNYSTTLYRPGGWTTDDYQDWNVYIPYKAAVQKNRGSAYLYQSFSYDFLDHGAPYYGNLTHTYEYDTATSGAWVRDTLR